MVNVLNGILAASVTQREAALMAEQMNAYASQQMLANAVYQSQQLGAMQAQAQGQYNNHDLERISRLQNAGYSVLRPESVATFSNGYGSGAPQADARVLPEPIGADEIKADEMDRRMIDAEAELEAIRERGRVTHAAMVDKWFGKYRSNAA